MGTRQTGRRRQIYIKKEFQFRFILKFCLILLAGVLLSTGLLFLFSRGTLTSSFSQSRLVITSTAEAMLPAMITTNLISLVLILIATIIVTLFISHKIAGPIYRLEKEIERIGAGDLSVSISLRSNDQMVAFAQRVNAMVAQLNQRVRDIQQQAEAINTAAADSHVPDELKSRAQQLSRTIREQFRL